MNSHTHKSDSDPYLSLDEIKGSWEEFFPEDIAERGIQYSLDGRVRELYVVTASSKQIVLSGTVKGRWNYSSTVVFSSRQNRIEFDANCSCPYGFDCKHAAAITHRFFLEGWRAQVGKLEKVPVAAPTPNVKQGAPEVQPLSTTVEKALDSLHSDPPTLSPMKMVPRYEAGYLLDFIGTPTPGKIAEFRVVLTAVQSTSGGFHFLVGDEDEFLTLVAAGGVVFRPAESDLPLRLGAVSINRTTRWNSYDPVARCQIRGAALLRALATERLFTKRSPWPIEKGSDIECRIGWRVDQKGRMVSTLSGLAPSSFVLNCPDVLLYYDPGKNQIGTILAIDPSVEPRAWLKVSSVQPAQCGSLVRALRSRALPVAGLEQFDEAAEAIDIGAPQPHLVIRSTERNAYIGGPHVDSEEPVVVRVGNVPESILSAELFFDYGVAEIASSSANTALKDPNDPSKVVFRNVTFEREVQSVLTRLGFIPFSRVAGTHGLPSKGILGVLGSSADDQLRSWMRILPELKKFEREQGWRLTVPDQLAFHIDEITEWFGAFESEGVGSHWFDGELGIIVDGRQHDLAPLLLSLIQKDSYQAKPIKSSSSKYVIIRGEGFSLQVERERILKILGVLNDLVEDHKPGKKLRLPLLRAHELQLALSATVSTWEDPLAIAELKERIRLLGAAPPVKTSRKFKGSLREYQESGVAWMSALSQAELGGILADDMGLGKTIQILAFLLHERDSGRTLPSLVVCPKSVAPNWMAEIAKFAQGLKAYRANGNDRAKALEELPDFDLFVTTYPLLVRDIKLLSSIQFNLAVFDEAQFIKNPTTLGYIAATNLQARLKIPVSGTPIENNLDELWGHFNLTLPGYLGNRTAFRRIYRTPIEKKGDEERRLLLAARIRPFVMRRTKGEVAKELPPVNEFVRQCELEDDQRDLYETIRQLTDKQIRMALQQKGAARSRIEFLDALLKLRQVCCDPRLVKSPHAHKVKSSVKLSALMELVTGFLSDGLSVVVFSQFTSMLALIETEITKRELSYTILSGETADRESPVRSFQSGEVPLMLMSLKAGGVGLNLTAADAVILYDPWWNPAVEEQAISRAHRIGRTKPVLVYRLIAQGSIEEKILDLQTRKKALVATLLPDGGEPTQLTEELIDYLLAPILPPDDC